MTTLIKNTILVDESHPLHLKHVNIVIKDEQIVSVTLDEVREYDTVIEAAYTSPGWIDLHVHCFDKTDLGVSADRIGVDQGVVMIVDAGSAGSDTIDDFYKEASTKKTIVRAWLNIAKTGLLDRHELKDPNNVDVEATIAKFKHYEDFLVGVKVRASGSVMGEDTVTPFIKAKQVCAAVGKGMMVHFGNNPPTVEEVLAQMGDRDVLTHCFHGKPNNILVGELVKPLVLDKRKEGVFFDVGHGQESFSFSISKKAMKAGFFPDSISTDLHKYNIDTPVGSLAGVMTKFLNLGLSLTEVVRAVTAGPATCAGLTGYGTLGSTANLSFFDVIDQESETVDSMGETKLVDKVIQPVGCMVKGQYWEAK